MPSARRARTPAPPPSPRYSGEEYLKYFESTEKVVDRRLALNSWNYGVCITIIIACGLVGSVAISNAQFRIVLMLAVAFLSSMGILLCYLWREQIKDYKNLNRAKFEVLGQMAPVVTFADGARSFEPFRKEWEEMEKYQALAQQKGTSNKFLKASNAELMMPVAFAGLFAFVLLVVAVAAVANWQTLIANPLAFQANSAAGGRQ